MMFDSGYLTYRVYVLSSYSPCFLYQLSMNHLLSKVEYPETCSTFSSPTRSGLKEFLRCSHSLRDFVHPICENPRVFSLLSERSYVFPPIR